MQYAANKLGGLSWNKFVEAFHAEGLVEVDIPTSTFPLNLLSLFQDPGGIFPEYKNAFSYYQGQFPFAEEFYYRAIKIPVWVNPSDERIIELYIQGFKKVIDNYKELL